MEGTARFAPLLARYLDELPNVREEMAKARAAEDRKSLAGLVHRLHGTGTCYGFEAITRAAGACEKALRSGAALDALPDLEVLDALLAAACEGRTPQPSLESA
jgi:HPt (histidine-containing phosphotransfer) domain-containing protein